jgi:hypothetical protein
VTRKRGVAESPGVSLHSGPPARGPALSSNGADTMHGTGRSGPAPLLLVLLMTGMLAWLPGCVHSGENGGGSSGGSSRTVLLAEDVEMGSLQDVYQLIQRHRSLWLRGRGALGPPIVYLNGQRRGSIQTLQDIPASDFFQAQLLSPAEATSLYGTGHASGVISVETRRR